MKKLKLSALALGASQMLTRDELKKVMAGSGSGGAVPCYQCCPNGTLPELCGQCNTSGNGGCQGNGKAWNCFCY